MANQEVAFEAGGKIYVLRFTQNALYKLETQLGHPLNRMLADFGHRELQALMWAGLEGARLKHNSRPTPYTIDEAGDIIDEYGGAFKAQSLLLQALMPSLPRSADIGDGGGEGADAPDPTKA